MAVLEKLKTGFKKRVKRVMISLYSPAIKKYRANSPELKILGVSGSVGKTSTKFAIAKVLEEGGKKVLVHDGAYNDPLTAIFVLTEQDYPNINSPLSLAKAYFRLRKASKSQSEYNFVVLELGTDMPGEMKQFKKFIELDVCVITAVTPEHMINFKSFDEVINEELEVVNYSKRIIACRDLIPKKAQGSLDLSGVELVWYGTANSNSARVKVGGLVDVGLNTKREVLVRFDEGAVAVRTSLLHLHSGFVIAAACLVAKECGVSRVVSAKALESITPAKGRGRLLAGKKGSIIIDDSYNNVGANVSIASLDLLYEFNTRHRIAVMGGINELSEDLEQETHMQVALHLNKKKLEEVVLIGRLAKKYYKPVLNTSDVRFKYFNTPYKAGNYLQSKLIAGTVVLVKGSQNGIYSEEAIKPLLQDAKDAKELVRQSEEWLVKKRKNFGL